MNELDQRLLFMALGLVVGLILGWTSRAAHDARQIKGQVMTETPTGRLRRLRINRNDVMFILFAIVLFGLTFVNQNRVDEVARCNADVTLDLTEAANERTTHAGEATRRGIDLWEAQAELLTVPPETPIEERRARLADYREFVEEYVSVQKQAAAQRREFPYPTVEEVERCAE